jgi:FAT domain
MDGRLTALMAESYKRAYPSMVASQNLAELEEVVEFRMMEEQVNTNMLRHPTNRHSVAEARKKSLSVWRQRLSGCQSDAEVHNSILAVRSLVLGPTDEIESILNLSELRDKVRGINSLREYFLILSSGSMLTLMDQLSDFLILRKYEHIVMSLAA